MILFLLALVYLQESSAMTCGSGNYFSPNKATCQPLKTAGQYCNAVQACAASLACESMQCRPSRCKTVFEGVTEVDEETNMDVWLEASTLEPNTVVLYLENKADEDLTISTELLYFKSGENVVFNGLLRGDVFIVEDEDGNEPTYLGKITNFAEQFAEQDLTVIKGKSISTFKVNIEKNYRLIPGALYTVRLNADVEVIRGDSVVGYVNTDIDDDYVQGIKAGTSTRAAEPTQTVPNGISVDPRCGQKNLITLDEVTTVTKSAIETINTRLNSDDVCFDKHLKYFFNDVTNARKKLIRDRLTLIKTYLEQAVANEKPLRIDCPGIGKVTPDDCSETTFAQVISTDPNTVIDLCPMYFKSKIEPYTVDSKPGTFIHEMAHFQVTAVGVPQSAANDEKLADGTDGYGLNGVLAMARSSPEKALTNADSYQYFCDAAMCKDPPLEGWPSSR